MVSDDKCIQKLKKQSNLTAFSYAFNHSEEER